MATNGISSMLNTRLRFSGMASGLDTESMIQQLMKVERMRVDKVKQDRQRLEWKRDDYREITNLLRSFKDEFFDILKPATNMRSASTYQKYTTEYGTPGVVAAVGGAGVSSLTHTIEVTRLASAASVTSSSEMTVNDTSATLGSLGVTGGSITINDKSISYQSSDTVAQLISKINSSDLGVSLSYSSFSKKFTITQKNTGAAGNVSITDTGSFLTAAKLNPTMSGGENALFKLDGILSSATGNTYSNNTFNVDGVTYTLLKEGTSTTVTLKQDTDAIYNNIKSFVDKYNSILEKINTELGEKFYRDFAPLTDEQKSEMSDKDIELWEEKSKSGLLRGDGLLSNLVTKMRNAVANAVDGITGTLASIGISTGDYRDKGKLLIDETKLKTALSNNPDKVIDLFTKESSLTYSPDMTAADRTTRDSQNGIVNRLFDILQDNIRTTRNNDGKKGFLLEKAGIIGDITEFKNNVTDLINDKDSMINRLIDSLSRKEESYYKKFSAMETALNNMNSQSAWIAQQFGGGQ